MKTFKSHHFLFFIGLLFTVSPVLSQIRISSPYSRYALGELQNSFSTYTSAMGGIGNGIRNPNYINMFNPASYSAFDTNSFVFDFSLHSTSVQLKTNVTTQGFSNLTSLGDILFGFPITHWCGFSAGLLPFSKTGYKVVYTDTLSNIGKVREEFIGKGGLNRIYGGVAFKTFKNISIGANVGYIFGTIFKNRSVYLPEHSYSYNIRVKNDMEVAGLYIDYGIQYHTLLPQKYTLVIGSRFNLPTKLQAKRSLLSERFTTSGEYESIKDTLLNIENEKGNIYMPMNISGGFTLSQANTWLVGADFSWYNWKNFKSFGLTDSVNNSFTFSAGGEYTPSYTANSYWKRMNYRLGFHYSRNYLDLHNKKINDFSVSLGMGFPIRKLKTTLNVSFEAGKKGTTSNNLIQENYIRLIFGISFREFWFYRPKLD